MFAYLDKGKLLGATLSTIPNSRKASMELHSFYFGATLAVLSAKGGQKKFLLPPALPVSYPLRTRMKIWRTNTFWVPKYSEVKKPEKGECAEDGEVCSPTNITGYEVWQLESHPAVLKSYFWLCAQ